MGRSGTSVLLGLLASYWLPILIVVVVGRLVRNRYHNGLNKYPGPFLASLTDLWRVWDVYGQRPELTHQRLHAKYGDVVRLGPNTLSFADPKALKTIYGLNKGFLKVGEILLMHPVVFIGLATETDLAITIITHTVRFLRCPAIDREGTQPGIPLQHDGQ